ncbi:hypothetical protein GZH47_32870 (plasmid) [Paenibacillus rhizovicinus]|uniref:Uncharacterized protein n=1 Tax=Paenibacillus rhizovicinus TaxID=2704463 RepID=A0A6C0PAX5_9BACL|nr:hypothetical protein [Paenibacillus rhizovicinus]QHW35687.1 hypothetical protein GZH47_32870 [Paenibacillus rhizovicinus]
MKAITRRLVKTGVSHWLVYFILMLLLNRPEAIVPAIREEELQEYERQEAFAG